MTREETKTILALLASVYSLNLMPAVTEMTINVWFQMLSDLDYRLAQTAVAAWVQTEKYPPTIADIREKCVTSKPDTAPKAWGKLNAAIKKYGPYHQGELLESITDPTLRRIVDQFTLQHFLMRLEANKSIDYAQFRDAYNAESKKEIYRAQISEPVRKALDGRAEKALGDGHDN